MPSTKRPAVETCDSTLTLVPDRRALELAHPLVPNAPGLVALTLSDQFVAWLRERNLVEPRTNWKTTEMDRLHVCMKQFGYDAGVLPFPLAPLPRDVLSDAEREEQDTALAELDMIEIKPDTVLSASLVRRLHLVALNGRARIKLLEKYGTEIPLAGEEEEEGSEYEDASQSRKRQKTGSAGGSTGGVQTKKKSGKSQKGGKRRKAQVGVASFRCIIYDSDIYNKPLLLRDVVVQDDIRLAYPTIEHQPTLRSTVTVHAAARDEGSKLATPVANAGKVSASIWEGMRNRSAAVQYTKVFQSTTALSTTLSMSASADIRRLFGRDFSSASVLISHDLVSFDSFLSTVSAQLSSPLSLDATILLLEVLVHHPEALPFAPPPAFSPLSPTTPADSLPRLHPNLLLSTADRRVALADVLRDTYIECCGSQGRPVVDKLVSTLSSRLKTGYSVPAYSDLWPSVDVKVSAGRAWAELLEVEKVLRHWDDLGLDEFGEEDGPVLDMFLGFLSLSSLAPPQEPAQVSCHDESSRGPKTGASLANWDALVLQPLLNFFVARLNSVAAPKDRIDEQLAENASLEDVLFALFQPSKARSLFRRHTGREERGGWLVPEGFAKAVSQLARWSFRHRFRLMTVYLTCLVLAEEDDEIDIDVDDPPSLFGDATLSTLIHDGADPAPHLVWRYAPYAELLDRLATLASFSPSTGAAVIDLPTAIDALRGDGDADAGEETLPLSVSSVERFLASEQLSGLHPVEVESRGIDEVRRLMQEEKKKSSKGKGRADARQDREEEIGAEWTVEPIDPVGSLRLEERTVASESADSRVSREASAQKQTQSIRQPFASLTNLPPPSPPNPPGPSSSPRPSVSPPPTSPARSGASSSRDPPTSPPACISDSTLASSASASSASTSSPASSSAVPPPSSEGGENPFPGGAIECRESRTAVRDLIAERMPGWSALNQHIYPCIGARFPIGYILLPAFASFLLSSRDSTSAEPLPNNLSLLFTLDKTIPGMTDIEFLSYIAITPLPKTLAVTAFMDTHRPLGLGEYLLSCLPSWLKPPIAGPLALALTGALWDLSAHRSPPSHLSELRLHLAGLAEEMSATGKVAASMDSAWSTMVELREMERGRRGEFASAAGPRMQRQAKTVACVSTQASSG